MASMNNCIETEEFQRDLNGGTHRNLMVSHQTKYSLVSHSDLSCQLTTVRSPSCGVMTSQHSTFDGFLS